jgi:hypothetical protein
MPEMELATRLLAVPALQRALEFVTLWTTAEQFPPLARSEGVVCRPTVDVNYLLTCASILALSDDAGCQDAALRIAHFVLADPASIDLQRAGAAVILDELTNTPALRLAESRNLVARNILAQIPLPLRLDALQRAARYSELDVDGQTVRRVNRFQKEVFDAERDSRWLSISAPTSAGKTYAVLQLVRTFVATRATCVVVFIVPTRALIQQMEGDLRDVLGGIPNVLIGSVPQLPTEWRARRMVFVFTQERFHLLLTEAPTDFAPDLVIVDEAQKIGDGARGVLLQDVLDALVRRAPDVRVIFASPMTSNPQLLLEGAPPGTTTQAIASEQIAVNQNLLWVSQQGSDTRDWRLSQCIGDATVAIGSIRLPNRPTTVGKRLPMLAHTLTESTGGGSLIYVEGAAAAEKAALLLWDMQSATAADDDPEIQALIDLVRSVVHEEYALVTTLTRRVAFHYGNMPLIIRSEIERLFKNGKIRFLACTSTLVEGVNLPAKSIFVRGPTKGLRIPMGEMDFWNLAGRAGRLGKEFQGNVVCVDPEDPNVWKTTPPRTRQRYAIVPTLDAIVSDRADDLVSYIESGTPRGGDSAGALEHAFVYFYGEHIRHGSFESSPNADRYPKSFVDRITGLCTAVAIQSDLPAEIIFRNPGVSPIAQQALLAYFREKGADIDDLIPAFPEDQAAGARYVKVVGRISKFLSGDRAQLNWPHAILVVSWMRGHPLSRIIAEAAAYWIPKGKTLASVIRDTMRNVEEYARFRFAKYSSCYVDILRYHLAQIGQTERAAGIPRLSIWLEFGASQGTQVALMGLGLSRTTAIRLSEIIADDDLDMEAALRWISSVKVEPLGLSPIMIAEILRARGVVA